MSRNIMFMLFGVAALGPGCGRPAPDGQRGLNQVRSTEPRREQPHPVTEPPTRDVDVPSFRFPEKPLLSWGDARLRENFSLNSVALRPDGKAVATATDGGTSASIWDTKTGHRLHKIEIPGAGPRPDPWKGRWSLVKVIGFTPDSKRIVVSRGDDVLVYDGETASLLTELIGVGGVYPRAISPDGRTLLANNGNGQLKLWSLETGRQLQELVSVPQVYTNHALVCFSPDGKQAATTLALRGHPSPRTVAAVVPVDGSKPPEFIYSREGAGSFIPVLYWLRPDELFLNWDTDHFTVVRPDNPKEVTQSPRRRANGRLVSLQSTAGRVFATFGEPLEVVELDPTTLAIKERPGVLTDFLFAVPPCITPDGKLLAVPWGNSVRLYDTTTWKSLHPDLDEQADATPQFMAFSSGNRLFASGNDSIRVWDGATGQYLTPRTRDAVHHLPDPPVHAIQGLGKYPSDVALSSPDGRWLAGVKNHHKGHCIVGDTTTGVLVYRESARPDGFSPHDTTRVAGFDRDKGVWLLDTPTGDCRRIELPSGRVSLRVAGFPQTDRARLSPDGRQLVVAGPNVLAIRRIDPDAEWQVMERYSNPAPSNQGIFWPKICGFSPDSRRLIVLTHDHLSSSRRYDDAEMTVWNLTGTSPAIQVRRQVPIPKLEPMIERNYSFTPDGRRLIQSGPWNEKGAELQVLEIATLKKVASLTPGKGWWRFALSPDGQRLVLGHLDTTFTAWDWPDLLANAIRPEGPLPPEESLWTSLASADARAAIIAVQQLVDNPNVAVPLLEERIAATSAQAIATLITDLGNDDFAVRENASKALAVIGADAAAPLRTAASESESPEVRNRASRLLRSMKLHKDRPSDATLRAIRAVEVLERIGSPEAKLLLSKWEHASAGTTLGREAKVASERLSK